MPNAFASLGTQSLSHPSFFTTGTVKQHLEEPNNAKDIKTALLAQYSQWKGTRYHWGGTTQRGVDCSSLMQHIFDESLHQKLPRTTFQQIKNGRQVDKEELKPGDLVFFKTTPGVRHVGVYLGNSQFMHASTSKGVTISSLVEKYWTQHYETARRLQLES